MGKILIQQCRNSIMLPPPPIYNAHRPPPPSSATDHGPRRRRRRPQSPPLSNSFRSCPPPPPPPQPRRHRSISPTMIVSDANDTQSASHDHHEPPQQPRQQQEANNDNDGAPAPAEGATNILALIRSSCTLHELKYLAGQQLLALPSTNNPTNNNTSNNNSYSNNSNTSYNNNNCSIIQLEEFQAIKHVVESDDCEAIVRVIEYCMLLSNRQEEEEEDHYGECRSMIGGEANEEEEEDQESVPESYTSEHEQNDNESVPASYCGEESEGDESICSSSSLDRQEEYEEGPNEEEEEEEEGPIMDDVCYQQIDLFNDRYLADGQRQFHLAQQDQQSDQHNKAAYKEGQCLDNEGVATDGDDGDEASTLSSYHFLSHIERNIIDHKNKEDKNDQPSLEESYRGYLASIRNGGFEDYNVNNNSSEELFCRVLCRHNAASGASSSEQVVNASSCKRSADESTASTSSTGSASTSSSSACSSGTQSIGSKNAPTASRRPPPRRMKSLGVPGKSSWAPPPPPPPRRSNSFKQLCSSKSSDSDSNHKQRNKSFHQGNGPFHKHPVPPPPPRRRTSVESTTTPHEQEGHSPNSVMDVNNNVNELHPHSAAPTGYNAKGRVELLTVPTLHPHSAAPMGYNAKGRVELMTMPTLPLPEEQDEEQDVVEEAVVQEVTSSRGDADERTMGSVQELFESVLSRKQRGFITTMPRQGTDDEDSLSRFQDELLSTAHQSETSLATVEDSSTQVEEEEEDTSSSVDIADQHDLSGPQQCVAGEIVSIEKISSIIDTLSSKRNVLDTLSSSATTELPPLSPLVEKQSTLSTNNNASLDVMLERLKATSTSSSTSTPGEFTNKDFIKIRYTNYLQQQLGNDDEDSVCESLSSYQQHMKQMFGGSSGPQNRLQQQVRTSKKRASDSKKNGSRVNPQDLSSCISTIEENGSDGNSRSRGARLEVQLEEDEKEHSKLMANVQDFISQIQ